MMYKGICTKNSPSLNFSLLSEFILVREYVFCRYFLKNKIPSIMIVIIPHNSHVLHSGTLNNCVFPIITKNVFIKLNTRSTSHINAS